MMKSISFALSTMAIFASLAMTPVGTQQRAIEPRMQLHAVNDWLILPGLPNFTRSHLALIAVRTR
jgi:hypothetical protein